MSELNLFDDENSAASPALPRGEGQPASPASLARGQGVKDTGAIVGPRLPAADTAPDGARWTDSITSHLAAALPGKARHRQIALRTLAAADAGGLTDFELAARTGIAQTSIGKRRKELQDFDLVEATPDTRPSPSGTPARVWVITDRGRQAALLLISNHAAETPTAQDVGPGLPVPGAA